MKNQITKGNVRVISIRTNTFNSNSIYHILNEDEGSISHSIKECEANEKLIAEAFNVTNNCGLTPAELLAQRNELLEASKEAYRCLFDRIVQQYNMLGGCTEQQAEQIASRDMHDFLISKAIKNATK